MINFNDMPDEIKTLIFGFNRAKQVEIEKDKFRMVMHDLMEMTELTYEDYYDIHEVDKFLNIGGFSYALIEAIHQVKADNFLAADNT